MSGAVSPANMAAGKAGPPVTPPDGIFCLVTHPRNYFYPPLPISPPPTHPTAGSGFPRIAGKAVPRHMAIVTGMEKWHSVVILHGE